MATFKERGVIMIVNKELSFNRRKVAIQEKLRRLESVAYGRGLEGLRKRVVELFNDIVYYRHWSQ